MTGTKLSLQITDENMKSENNNISNTTAKSNSNINLFLQSDQQPQNQLVQTNSTFSSNQYQNYESYQNQYENDYQLQAMISAAYNSYSEGLRGSDIFRYFRGEDQSQDFFENLSYTDTESGGDNTETKNEQQSIGEESTGEDDQNSGVWTGFVKIVYHTKPTAKKAEVLNHTQICQNCDAEFTSNNLLHKHLITCKESRKQKQRTHKLSVSNKVISENKKENSVQGQFDVGKINKSHIIESSAPMLKTWGLSFQSWHYLTMRVLFTARAEVILICADTGCTMSLIDWKFMMQHISNAGNLIWKLVVPIPVWGLRVVHHLCTDWLLIKMFLTGTVKGKTVVTKIFREIHVVEDLKANILLRMNILISEEVIIDLLSQTLKLTKAEGIKIPIQIKVKDNVNVNHIIRVKKQTVVPLKSVGQVLIQLAGKHQVLSNHNFLFELQKGSVYTHFVDSNFHIIQV